MIEPGAFGQRKKIIGISPLFLINGILLFLKATTLKKK